MGNSLEIIKVHIYWEGRNHGEGDNVQVMTIFKSSTPYWMIMLVCMLAIIVFPEIATFLPKALF